MVDPIWKLNEWLGSLSKISLKILVWLCDQSCLRGAVYCVIWKDCIIYLYLPACCNFGEKYTATMPFLAYISYTCVRKKGIVNT